MKYINDKGIVGVYVMVDPGDIGPGDEDLRGGRWDLTLVVIISQVIEVRTLALGDAAVNAERDAYIREGSPVKPVDAKGKGGPNVLNQKALEAYVKRLNEAPGVKVEFTISGTAKPGELVLEYVVTREERK